LATFLKLYVTVAAMLGWAAIASVERTNTEASVRLITVGYPCIKSIESACITAAITMTARSDATKSSRCPEKKVRMDSQSTMFCFVL
jgi:hypothetical protein